MLAFPQFSIRYSSLMFGSVSAKWFELLIIDVAQEGSKIDMIVWEGSARAQTEMNKKQIIQTFCFLYFLLVEFRM